MTQRGRTYWAKCGVCQYLKHNPQFKKEVMDSDYFVAGASESLASVVHRWGDPFKMPTVYSHMRRHQSSATRAIEMVVPETAISVVDLEGEVTSSTAHERGLDEIIIRGRDMVRRGEIKVTAQALLQAIKTKAEIEKSTKDRRLDAFKMMSGAFSDTGTTTKPDSKG